MDTNAFFNALTSAKSDALPNDPFKSVDNMLTRYDQVGQIAPSPSTSMSLPELAFKALNYPGNVVRSVLYGHGGSDIAQALSGQKQFDTRSQLTSLNDGLGKTLLSFAGDTLTDPTMLLGSGLLKSGGKLALESGLAKSIADKTAGQVVAKTISHTGMEAKTVEEALTGFKNPVTPTMNSIDASKAMLGDEVLTDYNLQQLKMRTGTMASTAASTAHRSGEELGKLLAPSMDGIVFEAGKGTPIRDALAKSISEGVMTGRNTWRTEAPRSFVDIFDRVQGKMGVTLNKDQVSELIHLHMAGDTQIHTILNIADQFGTGIKDFDNVLNMSKRFANADFIDKVTQANSKLLGDTAVRDATHVRAVFTNNLIADIDKLGNTRYVGIMTPTGKALVPLVDITPMANAVSKVADKAYLKIPGYKEFSDWFRTAISGDLKRSDYMEGLTNPKKLDQLLQAKQITKSYNLLKQTFPHIVSDFLRSSLGKDIVDSDPRILIGAVYGTERNILRDVVKEDVTGVVKDPYTAYIWANIADDTGKGAVSPGELSEARLHILSTDGEKGLQHIHDAIIDPFLAHNGSKLTQAEVDTALQYADKAKINTSVLFAHEKLQGSKLTENDYNPYYMRHMFEADKEGRSALEKLMSPKSIAMRSTNTGLRASHERQYLTIGEAIAHDLKLKPIDNLVELQAARFNESLRFGMNRALIKGVDDVFNVKLQTAVDKIISNYDNGEGVIKGLENSHVVRVQNESGKWVSQTVHVSPEQKVINEELKSSAQSTADATIKALGGSKGLKALKEVVRTKKELSTSDLTSGTWIPLDTIYGISAEGGGSLYYGHKSIMPYVETLNRPMTNSSAMNSLLEFTDHVTRIIKTLQTTLSPTFAVRNFGGEGVMSFGNGTSMRAMTEAKDVLSHIHGTATLDGKDMYINEISARLKIMDPADHVTLGGKDLTVEEAKKALHQNKTIDLGNGRSMTIQDLHDSAVRQGLITAGHTSEYNVTEYARLKQSVSGLTAKDRVKNAYREGNKVTGPIRAGVAGAETAANYGDALFRLGDYIHNLREGLTEVKAAARVKTYHVDYNNLTSFEKLKMRRIVPYYTFMRQNIPIQLRLMIERPAYYGTMGKLMNNSYGALQDPATPDYLRKNMALPIYTDDNGNTHYLNWNLPMTDLAKFRLDPRDTAKEFMQNLTPLIKAPLELATGHNIAFQAPVKPMDYLSSQLGGASTVGKAIAEATAPDTQFEGMYAKPRQIPLVGGFVPTVNPQKEELSRAYAYREQLLADMQAKKKAGQGIPELPAVPHFGGISATKLGLTPYNMNPNYLSNKDWVRTHGNKFTP